MIIRLQLQLRNKGVLYGSALECICMLLEPFCQLICFGAGLACGQFWPSGTCSSVTCLLAQAYHLSTPKNVMSGNVSSFLDLNQSVTT